VTTLASEQRIDQLAREARNKYKREWVEKNREHVNEYQRLYHRLWRSRPENKERIRIYNKRYWQKKAMEQLQAEDVE
jgi:hypothetical protein